ncbi:hypothetical protein [Halorubrum halophilum]|uniref:hypothetical protein n=1 Tax=Halorubrum halophilum TaxID=413816 RepID=UPI00186B1B85|nr:hypothetical protein [Halorubrum halophilum]
MTTTRRRYLRGLGAGSALLVGSAGCVDRAPGAGDGSGDGGADDGSDDGGADDGSGDDGLPGDDSTDDGADGTRPRGTGGPGISVRSVDGLGDFPVSVAVAVVNEAATESSPPRIRTTLTNTSEEPVTVGEGRAAHLEYVYDDTRALVWLPAADAFPAEPGCWRLTDSVVTTEEYRTFDLEPGATSERSVDLYATPGEDACLPVGEYRFRTPVSIGGPDSADGSSGEWGLTVVLE